MKIFAMFGAYKDRADVPELLDAWDEYARDDNPDGYMEDHQRWSTDPDLVAFTEVTFEVDEQAIRRALSPEPLTLKAAVVGDRAAADVDDRDEQVSR